jgi:hypothetical protein
MDVMPITSKVKQSTGGSLDSSILTKRRDEAFIVMETV